MHPLVADPFVTRVEKYIELVQKELAYLPNDGSSIFDHSDRYTLWARRRGICKRFIKYAYPLIITDGARHNAQTVFGKDPSPINALGTHSVSSLVRYCLYERGWSGEAIVKYLVDNLDHNSSSARALVHRQLQDTEKSRRIFNDRNEKQLIGELKVV